MAAYWGIWGGTAKEGGWVRDTDGRYVWYPDESIAAEHAKEMSRPSPWSPAGPHHARRFGGPLVLDGRPGSEAPAGQDGAEPLPHGTESARHLTHEELRDGGYLQEVNRRFFHPLGLALASEQSASGEAALVVFDHRQEADGVIFGAAYLATDEARAKHDAVEAERERREPARRALLGGRVVEAPTAASTPPPEGARGASPEGAR